MWNRILYAPDSAGGTGDGTGKSKSGNSQETSENNQVTRDMVQSMIEATVTQATQRTLKKVDALIKDSITSVTAEDSPLMQQFAELKKTLGGEKKSAKKDANTSTEIPDDVQAQINAQSKQIEKLQTALQKAENEKKSREEQDRNNKRRSNLTEFLDKQGFKTRAKAVAALHWSDIKWEDDGSELGKPVIRNSKGEEVSYQDYVAQEFVKSDEGKDLLAVDVTRTGSGAGEHDSGVPGLNIQQGNTPDLSKMTDKEIEDSFAALVK